MLFSFIYFISPVYDGNYYKLKLPGYCINYKIYILSIWKTLIIIYQFLEHLRCWTVQVFFKKFKNIVYWISQNLLLSLNNIIVFYYYCYVMRYGGLIRRIQNKTVYLCDFFNEYYYLYWNMFYTNYQLI